MRLSRKLALPVACLMIGGGVAFADDQSAHRQGGTAQQHGKTSGGSADVANQQYSAEQVKQMLSSWPQDAQKAGQEMMNKYGAPQGVTPTPIVTSERCYSPARRAREATTVISSTGSTGLATWVWKPARIARMRSSVRA